MSKNTKEIISMFLETEEGKKLGEKMRGYEKHSIEEKIAFVTLMEEVPELLKRLDNMLRYNFYLDDVIAYRSSKMNEVLFNKTIELC